MGKIDTLDHELSLEKNGRPVSDTSNISQALKYTTPVNGVLKLYLYEKNEYLNVTVDNLKQSQAKPAEAKPKATPNADSSVAQQPP